ncbi:MAG: hypothetical protein PUE14_09690, partial [Clostridia bacterium]|nr:hypothetical protein [Clostridia bacterium]
EFSALPKTFPPVSVGKDREASFFDTLSPMLFQKHGCFFMFERVGPFSRNVHITNIFSKTCILTITAVSKTKSIS